MQISRDCQELEPFIGEQLASLLYLEPDSELTVGYAFIAIAIYLGFNILITFLFSYYQAYQPSPLQPQLTL